VRTADNIEQQHAQVESVKPPKYKRGENPKSRANLVAPWPKGKSANPGGLPGTDVAARIARAVLEANEENIYRGLAERAIEGNAYTFKELAERGYGKLTEHHEHHADDALLAALAAGRKRASDGDGS
jgi:hypothetical protein